MFTEHLFIFYEGMQLWVRMILLSIARVLHSIDKKQFSVSKKGIKRSKKILSMRKDNLRYQGPVLRNYYRQKLNKTERVVYTCITGSYDFIQHHKFLHPDWDYVCFTDDPELVKRKRIGAWEIRSTCFQALDNVRNARWHKLHPHLILKDYTYSLWCDGNCNILDETIFLRTEALIYEQETLCVSRHYERDCVYDEIEACIAQLKDNPDLIKSQRENLIALGYPQKNGLHETCLIFREHQHPVCKRIMDLWWEYVYSFSRRDQLSFDVALWENDVTMQEFLVHPIRVSGHIQFYYPPNHYTAAPTSGGME